MSPRTEAGTFMQHHDLGCKCWPHVSERDAIEAITEEARKEYREGVRLRAEARAQALEEVRAGVEGLPLAKALSDMNYRAVLALLDRLSKGTDG